MLKYKFYCPICQKEVKRNEVHPVVVQHESTPTGFPRQVIVRAFHFPNCIGNGDLKITVLEGEQVQKKLEYSFDEKMSGRDKHVETI